MTDNPFPVLYILMRSDLDSMNAGKAMAQASHASNAFVQSWNDREHTTDTDILGAKWMNSTDQGFGTVLVLEVNEKQLNSHVEAAKSAGFIANIVNDPTYPVRDGTACHFIPVDTCGYVFGDKNDITLQLLLGDLSLHP